MKIRRIYLKFVASLLIPILLVGCGTFSLGTAIPQTTKTSTELQLDTLDCKDKARLAASAADVQIKAFLLGLTIIGAPAGRELEKSKQREMYKSCMEGKGYRVIPPVDGPNEPGSQTLSGVTTATFDFPAGWEKKDLTQSLLDNGGSLYLINNAVNGGSIIFSAKLSVVGSASGYIQARVAAMLSALDNSSAKEIIQSSIKGFSVTQVEITGNLKSGQKPLLTYLLTFYETSEEVVLINIWSSANNFPAQKPEFLRIINTISGVSPPINAPAKSSPITINIENGSSASETPSSIYRLNNLNELLKKGLINQKDYDSKKSEILKTM